MVQTSRGPDRSAEPEPSARGDRRRAELVQAGMDCLVRDGWPGLTHRKVAEQASANAGLMHYYFGNLAGLRSAIARSASDHLILPVMEELCATETTDELASSCAALLSTALKDPHGVQLLTQLIVGAAHYEDVADVIRTDIEYATERLAGHLVELRAGWSATESRHAAALIIAILDGILLHALVRADRTEPPPRRQLDLLIRSVLLAPS